MRIPEIAARLRALATQQGLPELSDLAAELHRRPTIRRARPTSDPMTPAKARAIRRDRRMHPNASQAEIARRHNVNPGRVSEALRGKRT